MWSSPLASLFKALFALFGFWQTISGVPDVVGAWLPIVSQYDSVWRIAFLLVAFVLSGTLWREIEAVPAWARSTAQELRRSPLEIVYGREDIEPTTTPYNAIWGGRKIFDNHDLYRVAVRTRGSRSIDGVRVWLVEHSYWSDENAEVYTTRFSRPLRLYGDSAPYDRSLHGVRVDPGPPRHFWDVVWRANNWKNAAELLFADALVSDTTDPKFGSVPSGTVPAQRSRVLLEATGIDVRPSRSWFGLAVSDMGLSFSLASGPPKRPD
jgi:hypothetical protein